METDLVRLDPFSEVKYYIRVHIIASLPTTQAVKNLPAIQETQETWVQFLGQERSPVERNGNPLQFSCLENPRDRGSWGATVHGVTKSWTRQHRYNL